MRVEVAAEGDGEDVPAEHGREGYEAPVLREVRWCEKDVSICAFRARTTSEGGRTEAEPLDDEGGEEAEEAAIREAEERARLPEVLDVHNGVAGRLGDDEHGRDEDDAEGARETELALHEVCDDS